LNIFNLSNHQCQGCGERITNSKCPHCGTENLVVDHGQDEKKETDKDQYEYLDL